MIFKLLEAAARAIAKSNVLSFMYGFYCYFTMADKSSFSFTLSLCWFRDQCSSFLVGIGKYSCSRILRFTFLVFNHIHLPLENPVPFRYLAKVDERSELFTFLSTQMSYEVFRSFSGAVPTNFWGTTFHSIFTDFLQRPLVSFSKHSSCTVALVYYFIKFNSILYSRPILRHPHTRIETKITK